MRGTSFKWSCFRPYHGEHWLELWFRLRLFSSGIWNKGYHLLRNRARFSSFFSIETRTKFLLEWLRKLIITNQQSENYFIKIRNAKISTCKTTFWFFSYVNYPEPRIFFLVLCLNDTLLGTISLSRLLQTPAINLKKGYWYNSRY